MPVPSIERLDTLSQSELTSLRESFRAAGFLPAILAEAESIAPGQLDAVALPLVRWILTRRGDAAARLARLFSYAESLDRPVVEGDLGEGLVSALCRAGILVPSGAGRVSCPFRMVPLEDLWIVADEPTAGAEAVMGPGPTTLELLGQLPERCSGSVLDIGTGAGTLALVMAARGADRVVATDVSARAWSLASFNARLNGLELDVRMGDLGEPVRGERFRWVVSQPSYVFQAPTADRVTFLHGGPRGDELAFRLLGELPSLLMPEGTALMLFDTPLEPGRPLAERIRAAVGDPRLDLFLLVAPGPSANAQAVAYAALEDPGLGQRYADAVGRNLGYLATLHVREWGHLLAVIRWPATRPEGITAQLRTDSLLQGGPRALVTLLSSAELATLVDPELLGVGLGLHPRCRVLGQIGEGGRATHLRLQLDRGVFAAPTSLTATDLRLFWALEGSGSVREALEQCSQADRQASLERIRELLARGLLVQRAAER